MVLQMLRVRALRRENARSPTSVMKEIEGSASRKSAWRRDHRRRKTRQRSRKGGQSGDAAGQNLQQLEELVAVKLLVPVFVRSLERQQQRVLAGQRLRGECARAALGRVRAGARAHARRRGCSGITSSTGLMASAEWPSMYLQREPSSRVWGGRQGGGALDVVPLCAMQVHAVVLVAAHVGFWGSS